MAGISSSALKGSDYPKNRKKYNGIEHTTDLDLNQYDAFYRTLDPQIGRFWQIDPKPDMVFSAYAAMSDNPVLLSDPLGDTVRIHFRVGFLGLGGKRTVNYENGKVTNTDGSAYAEKTKGFLKRTVNALDNIRTGGANGQKLVTDLQNSSEYTNIVKGSSNSYIEYDTRLKLENRVSWNPSSTEGGLDIHGSRSVSSFIGLGHELGHSHDKITDDQIDYRTWFTMKEASGKNINIPNAERYSTHWENLLRSENNLPLRQYYGVDNTTGSPIGRGDILIPGTRYNANYVIYVGGIPIPVIKY